MHLQAGALLKNGEYKIEKVLGQGGFGITYLAEQTSLGRKVALKEFFMEGLCNRDADTLNVSVGSVGSKKLVERFKQKFIKEARMIASFDNSHIISIHDVFEENGTAYYVMEYLGGKSLSAIVNEQGIMSETLAMKYIRQVADALAEVHANNLLHLDVKPANIMLNKKGEAVLIDFGISKHYDEAGNQTSSALIGTSEGYAPIEQYEAGALDSFTPATDIYALGATLFFLLIGTRPPKAGDVMNDGLPELPSEISQTVSGAITAAMQPRRKDRPQSIAEFLCLVESGKMQDESDGETELNGNVKAASKREGENLFTHTASESSFDEVKGENGELVADEFQPIDVVEVPDSEDAVISNEGEKSHSADAVIFRGKPSTARLSVSEESQPANNEILRSAQNDNSANGRQNDKDGKEEVERRNEKERSTGAVISNESEKSQKNKPGKSLWLILLLLLLIAVAGAWFLFSGTGNGDAPKRDTKKQIEKKDTPASPKGEEQEKPVEKGDSVQTPEPIVPMCRLTLTQIPDGAEVYINDSPIGNTPIKNHEIPQGTHNIKITKDGYKDYEETFTLDGKERTISPTLEKSQKSVAGGQRGIINGHDYVDLALSVNWATCNVGASNPSDYGYHYAWGEVYTKQSYSKDNNFTYGEQISSIVGKPSYDVARAKWGGSWRLPTREEFQELIDNCIWKWTNQGGHCGYRVTSKTNGNSIFLPAAAYRINWRINGKGVDGRYWSASPNEGYTDIACSLSFDESSRYMNWSNRYYGHSIRPVCK